MSEGKKESRVKGEESGRAPIGKLVLLGFLAGGGFGFLVTLIYLIFR